MTQKFRTNLMVLAGPLCSGKTTLALALVGRLGVHVVSARRELKRHGATNDRRDLQAVGSELERQTDGAWLASAVQAADLLPAPVVVDSARTRRQVEALRELSDCAVVVYLTASLTERKRRYAARDDPIDRGSLAAVDQHELEAGSEVAVTSDVQVATDGKTPSDVVTEVLGLVTPLRLETHE